MASLDFRRHPRIVVIGTSASGKTTLSRQLADALGRPHLEMDAYYWGPDWTPRADFRSRVEIDVAQDEWILDGNYNMVRDLVWSRATAIVWLNYSFRIVFGRALSRTIRRVWTAERLYGGNRETFRLAFLDRDGIPAWVIRTHHQRRREFGALFAEPRAPQFAHLTLLDLRSPAEAEALVEAARASSNARTTAR